MCSETHDVIQQIAGLVDRISLLTVVFIGWMKNKVSQQSPLGNSYSAVYSLHPLAALPYKVLFGQCV